MDAHLRLLSSPIRRHLKLIIHEQEYGRPAGEGALATRESGEAHVCARARPRFKGGLRASPVRANAPLAIANTVKLVSIHPVRQLGHELKRAQFVMRPLATVKSSASSDWHYCWHFTASKSERRSRPAGSHKSVPIKSAHEFRSIRWSAGMRNGARV